MDRLKAMATFVRVVEANSFAKAAETLSLPPAAVTKTIQNLEAYLGTKLLQRSTRRLSLTPDGAEYFEKCTDILAIVEAAEIGFREQDLRRPKGKLRVDLPGAVGRGVVVPRIASFTSAYPELELVMSLTDRLVDVTGEGIDCAVRVGQLQDSSLVGRQIGSMRFVTCAAPSYLAQYGVPTSLEGLDAHRAIIHFSGRTGRAFDWDFQRDGQVIKRDMAGAIAVDDADAHISCGLQGLGLMQAARYQTRAHVESGALIEVLTEWEPVPMPVSLLYPRNRMALPKVRLFAEWVSALFRDHPDFGALPAAKPGR
ncbi:MAG: LysR family transcriptional regulator [Massilia sp.]